MNKLSYFIGAATLCLSASAAQAKEVSVPIKAPGILKMTFDGGCNNKGGPYITLGSSLTINGIRVKLHLSGGNGNHTNNSETTAAVTLNFDEALSFHKQPPLEGVTGNPIVTAYVENYKGEWVKLFSEKCTQL